jgi:hypothetical protein
MGAHPGDGTPLPDLLVERGWPTGEGPAAVEVLAAGKLRRHGDPVRGLAAVVGDEARRALAEKASRDGRREAIRRSRCTDEFDERNERRPWPSVAFLRFFRFFRNASLVGCPGGAPIALETTVPPPPARRLGKASQGYTVAPFKAKPTESA